MGGYDSAKTGKWIYKHKDQLEVKFIGAIGAVFDFYTENVKGHIQSFKNLAWNGSLGLCANPVACGNAISSPTHPSFYE